MEAQIWDVVKEFGEDLWKCDFTSFVNAHILKPACGYYSGRVRAKAVRLAADGRFRDKVRDRYLRLVWPSKLIRAFVRKMLFVCRWTAC